LLDGVYLPFTNRGYLSHNNRVCPFWYRSDPIDPGVNAVMAEVGIDIWHAVSSGD